MTTQLRAERIWLLRGTSSQCVVVVAAKDNKTLKELWCPGVRVVSHALVGRDGVLATCPQPGTPTPGASN